VYAQDNESHSSNSVYIEYSVPANDDEIAPVVLIGNYPNPFNPSTTIYFSLPVAGEIALAVYNTKGQFVCRLVDGCLNAGEHEVIWNGEDENKQVVASGIYFFQLKREGETVIKRMVMIK
jgi:flagellar hook assembly protein FlgD